ncbi:MAG TPA: diguanylate cyclase [Solirubrobacteraceae bacterium]|nr:diguanylate cyclase [Solirubrobacteraceae bacterium]
MNARVLIAEDCPLQRAMFAEALRAEGFEVYEASDGRTALDLCRMLRPDLLLLDLQPPRLAGDDVIARVRADQKVGATPILVLTDDEREQTISALLRSGATECVAKPPRHGELVARVHCALSGAGALERERHRRQGNVKRLDPLTGLPNRRVSTDALSAAAASAQEHHRPLAVALVDVDHFRSVNDTYGRQVGDQVLCALAGRLVDHARHSDMIGRWDGEAFIAVLPGAGTDVAAAAAETLRRASAASKLQLEQGLSLLVTVSVGWASGVAVAPDRLLELADAALQEAKAAGRNRVAAGLAHRELQPV